MKSNLEWYQEEYFKVGKLVRLPKADFNCPINIYVIKRFINTDERISGFIELQCIETGQKTKYAMNLELLIPYEGIINTNDNIFMNCFV